jgi:hypothetical protein
MSAFIGLVLIPLVCFALIPAALAMAVRMQGRGKGHEEGTNA